MSYGFLEYLVGLFVPTGLLLASMFSKKLVRGKGWMPTDFYLGVELTLGAMTTGLLQVFDVLKPFMQMVNPTAQGNPANPPPVPVAMTLSLVTHLVYVVVYLVVTFLMFLFVVCLHQNWEDVPQCPEKTLKLGVLANVIGFLLMVSFFLVVKGVHR